MQNIFQKLRGQRSNQRGIGGRGEDLAATYLRKSGYTIIASNWYNMKGKRIGEIDLVASRDEVVAFVEVKTRKAKMDCNVLQPQEQITPAKLHKIAKTAELYMSQSAEPSRSWRIDCVSVVLCNKHKMHIEHIESIFY